MENPGKLIQIFFRVFFEILISADRELQHRPIQYQFREHFRDSILSNQHASFEVHWTKARTKQFGFDCPVNITSFHDIFMDRISNRV